MLVHLAESRHGGEVRLVEPLGDFAGKGSRRADIGDPPPGDDDFLILPPCSRMHIEQPPDAQRPVGRTLAHRHKHQVLPDQDFVLGIEQRIQREGSCCGSSKLRSFAEIGSIGDGSARAHFAAAVERPVTGRPMSITVAQALLSLIRI